MIILSGVLVVVAIALLVAGIVAGNGESAQVFGLDALVVIYISIAVSIVSALCLAIGVFLRRRELFGGTGATPAPAKKKSKKAKKAPATPPRTKAPVGPAKGEPADDTVTIPAPPANVPDDAAVFVVRGRKRYHLDTCRQLAGRDKEELTYVEAKEEGFSPCTACMPDTALAARAAVSVPADPKKPTAKPGDAPPKPGTPAGPKSANVTETAELPRPTAAPAAPKPSPMAAPTPPPAPKISEDPLGDPTPRPAKDEPSSFKAPEPPADAPPLPSAWGAPAPAAGPGERTVTDLPLSGAAPTTDDPAPPKPRESGDTPEQPKPAETPAAPPAPKAAEPAPSSGSTGADPQVRILSGTKRYHRTDCALIEDIGDEADDLEALSRTEAKARGCTPCLVCQPDKEHARD